MATNLLIGYPQVVSGAGMAATPQVAAAAGCGPENLQGGGRGQTFKLGSAQVECNVVWDTGASNAYALDFFYVARVDLLKAQGSTRVRLESSADNVTYANHVGVSPQAATLYGPRGEDLIMTAETHPGSFPISTTCRYFRHYAAFGDPAGTWEHSKAWWGNWLDLGRDPIFPRQVALVPKAPGERAPRHAFAFTWRGISDAKRAEFLAALVAQAESGCVLYTRSYHPVLLNYRVLHCRLAAWTLRRRAKDGHEINATFEELI